MAMSKGAKIEAVGAVADLASSFISTWGAYSASRTATKSANRVAKIHAKSAADLAAISNLRVDVQTDLELYFQAETFEANRRAVLDKSLEVQTAVLKAKGEASAAQAFTGIYGQTAEVEANLLDIQGERAVGQTELEMVALTRANALAVGNTLLTGSRQKQTQVFTPQRAMGPSGALAIGGGLADTSRVLRELREKI